jgi:disulfide bond formation protein DsbB
MAAAEMRGAGGSSNLGLARALAILVPAALLAGAWGSQIWGGLIPCEMCWWQRYAHIAALALALLALLLARTGAGRALVALAALAILTSGGIGFYHAGVEAHIFKGVTQCTAADTHGTAAELIDQIMSAPIVPCDVVQWRFLGLSMAAWNAILSIGFGLSILWLILKRPRQRP